MRSLHVSQHAIDVAEEVAVGSILTAVLVVAAICAAALVYTWFIA